MKIAVIGAGLMGPAITKDSHEDNGVGRSSGSTSTP